MAKVKEKLLKLPTNLLDTQLRMVNSDRFSRINLEKVRKSKLGKKYTELQTITDTKTGGTYEKLVEVDYPITADYVKSFEQSTDYRLDVDNAIANGKKGNNLGDVTMLQDIYKMDTAQIAQFAQNLKALQDKLKISKNEPVKEVDNAE